MENDRSTLIEQVDAGELELLTDLLLLWCEKNGRNPEDLLHHCSLILERYRSGADTAENLFEGL